MLKNFGRKGQGSIRKGGEGGEGGSEGGREGGGFGRTLPPPMGLLWSPPKAGRKFLKLQSSWHRKRRSKILAVSLKHYKRRREGGRGSMGREVRGVRGGTPPPPTVYGRSNTSLPPPPHPRGAQQPYHSPCAFGSCPAVSACRISGRR